MKKLKDMQVGPETVDSDVCSMLRQLESCTADDGAPITSLIDRVNSTLSKLPPDSLLHAEWHKTRSQYEETTALVDHCRSAHTRLAVDEKDFCGRIETPPSRSSDDVCNISSTGQQSCTENRTPPVCHVKPTQILNETTSSSPTAPFDVRNYLIDKNAPVTEPVFKPQLALLVQDSTVKSLEVARRRSSDGVQLADLQCTQPLNASVKSTFKPATAAQPAGRSRWKVLKKKAVNLLKDGHPSSQSEHSSHRQVNVSPVSSDSLQRFDCSSYI